MNKYDVDGNVNILRNILNASAEALVRYEELKKLRDDLAELKQKLSIKDTLDPEVHVNVSFEGMGNRYTFDTLFKLSEIALVLEAKIDIKEEQILKEIEAIKKGLVL